MQNIEKISNYSLNHIKKIILMVGKRILDFILPPRCEHCGDNVLETATLCVDCWGKLPFIQPPFCPICNGSIDKNNLIPGQKCQPCQSDIPPYDRARAILQYQGIATDMILKFKHANQISLARFFARLLLQSSAEVFTNSDYLLPIPLHHWRLFKRGYNQSARLAQELSAISGIKVSLLALRRSYNSPSQGRLKPEERIKNLENAFAISANWRKKLQGKRVILIDDVLTSGATIEACSLVLRQVGVKDITALSIARVDLPRYVPLARRRAIARRQLKHGGD